MNLSITIMSRNINPSDSQSTPNKKPPDSQRTPCYIVKFDVKIICIDPIFWINEKSNFNLRQSICCCFSFLILMFIIVVIVLISFSNNYLQLLFLYNQWTFLVMPQLFIFFHYDNLACSDPRVCWIYHSDLSFLYWIWHVMKWLNLDTCFMKD